MKYINDKNDDEDNIKTVMKSKLTRMKWVNWLTKPDERQHEEPDENEKENYIQIKDEPLLEADLDIRMTMMTMIMIPKHQKHPIDPNEQLACHRD